MLAQHMITKPVFDALFEHYEFTENNPISIAMQSILSELKPSSIKQDTVKLKAFYDSVKMRVKGVDNAEGRQRVVVELYDKFFKVAFPKMAERLGIVYRASSAIGFKKKRFKPTICDSFGSLKPFAFLHFLYPIFSS